VGFEFHDGADADRGARGQANAMIDRLVDYLKTLQPGYYD
jgi:hypothetical protein